jgi:putative NADPH-quinone reductase
MSRGRLRDRPVILLGVAGSRDPYRKYGYGEAMRVQIDVSLLGYCGLRDVETHVFYDVEQSPENRQRYLAAAREIGRDFGSRQDAARAGFEQRPGRLITRRERGVAAKWDG